MVADQFRIARVPLDSDRARDLLSSYYAELDARFPGGFDPERPVSAPGGELEPPSGAFLVVYIDGVPVGCGGVRAFDEGTAELKKMWIDPAARGRGVGRQLLEVLEKTAVELGYCTLGLDTSAHLSEAIALYRSAGYRDIAPYNDNLYAGRWFEK